MNDQLFDTPPATHTSEPQIATTAPLGEYERKLLASILAEPDQLKDVTSELLPNHFTDPRLRLLYEAMLHIDHGGVPVTTDGLIIELENQGHIDTIGGREFVLGVAHEGDSSLYLAPAQVYASKVRIDWGRQSSLNILSDHLPMLSAGSGQRPEDVIALIQRKLSDVTAEISGPGGLARVADMVDDYDAILEERAMGNTAIETPWESLTDLLSGGFQAGTLGIIAARPGEGKSVSGVAFLKHAAMAQRKKTLVITLEMSRVNYFDRLVANIGRINSRHLIKGKLDEDEIKRKEIAKKTLKQLDIAIEDSKNTFDTIRAKALREQENFGLDLLVIDYLQLVHNPDGTGANAQFLRELSNQLKGLAKELNIPIIALGQIKIRTSTGQVDSNGEETNRPHLRDIGGTDGAAEASDWVLLLWKNLKDPSKIMGSMDKNRNGETTNKPIVLGAQFEFSDMRELTRHEDAAIAQEEAVRDEAASRFDQHNPPAEIDPPNEDLSAFLAPTISDPQAVTAVNTDVFFGYPAYNEPPAATSQQPGYDDPIDINAPF